MAHAAGTPVIVTLDRDPDGIYVHGATQRWLAEDFSKAHFPTADDAQQAIRRVAQQHRTPPPVVFRERSPQKS